MSLLPVRSTKRPLVRRKSAPRIDFWTSATWNCHVYLVLSMWIVIWQVPNNLMRERFAATRFKLGGLDRSG